MRPRTAVPRQPLIVRRHAARAVRDGLIDRLVRRQRHERRCLGEARRIVPLAIELILEPLEDPALRREVVVLLLAVVRRARPNDLAAGQSALSVA